MKKIYLAVDTSYEQGAVALFSDEEIIFTRTLHEKFAHAKLLCEAIDEALVVNNAIAGVMCGLGPGSFVGVRVALATMLGFCFGRSLPLMGFCSHRALALSVGAHDAIFMKASGALGYLTKTKDPGTSVVALKDLALHVQEQASVVSDQTDLIEAQFPDRFVTQKIIGPSPQGIVAAARERLQQANGIVDERASIKPNYVKPPSVSLPSPRAN